MILIKVYNDRKVHYFSTKAKASKWLKCKPSNVQYYINYGKEFTEEDIDRIINELDHPYVAGLSLLGGEPLEYSNQKGLLPLLKREKEKFPEKDIWCYTGYTYEYCLKHFREELNYIDVLVDGKFMEQYKGYYRYKGSSNQRIIDVQKSLKNNKIEVMQYE